jgi:leucyl-tRNA synthetase
MFKNGLAYKGTATVNWCPSCLTVLADEQVESGVCERCGTEVERKKMSSWFFKITDYADRLLQNLEVLDWPKKIKTAQRRWIGKKEGALVSFKIAGSKQEIEVFTTRLDTIFGATFMVLAPEVAQKMLSNVPKSKQKEVSEYIKRSLNKTEQQRRVSEKEKTGVDMGIFAINPASKEKIPIFVADYVLTDYGTGSVMGVPAHDSRDFDFAKKYKLKMVEVVKGKTEGVYDGEGKLKNSGKYDGLESMVAREKMFDDFKFAKPEVNYHLRDWLISRQRYWGPPIPMIHCENCENKGWGERKDMPGWHPVPEKDLPVILPKVEDFQPTGTGDPPLANAAKNWKEIKCPKCGKVAERELEVSDTFLDSSWYFLRYPSVGSKSQDKFAFDPEITKKWLPVNAYIGGAEHAVLHLLYSRFVTMALADWGFLNFEEPFSLLFTHGLLIKEGAKMSKSRGNVVVPDEYIKKYGADVLRTYLMFLGPYSEGGNFQDSGIEGMSRFFGRVWDLYMNHKDVVLDSKKDSEEVLTKLHKTIKKVTEEVENFRYNTAIASIMELVNLLREKSEKAKKVNGKLRCAEWDEALGTLGLLLAPFAPHTAEEIWVDVLGKKFSVHTQAWPRFKKELILEKQVVVAIQVNGKLRGTLSLETDLSKDKEKVISLARKEENISKWIKDMKIKETIFVPGKILNFVLR